MGIQIPPMVHHGWDTRGFWVCFPQSAQDASVYQISIISVSRIALWLAMLISRMNAKLEMVHPGVYCNQMAQHRQDLNCTAA